MCKSLVNTSLQESFAFNFQTFQELEIFCHQNICCKHFKHLLGSNKFMDKNIEPSFTLLTIYVRTVSNAFYSCMTDNISGQYYYLLNTTLLSFQEQKYFRRIDALHQYFSCLISGVVQALT